MCKWSIVNAIKHCWEVNNHWKVFIGFKAAEAAADLEESNFNEAGRAENKLQCLVEEEWKGERIYSGSLPVKERRMSVRGEGRVIKIGCNKKIRHNNNNERASLRWPCKRTWTNVERTNNGGLGGNLSKGATAVGLGVCKAGTSLSWKSGALSANPCSGSDWSFLVWKMGIILTFWR